MGTHSLNCAKVIFLNNRDFIFLSLLFFVCVESKTPRIGKIFNFCIFFWFNFGWRKIKITEMKKRGKVCVISIWLDKCSYCNIFCCKKIVCAMEKDCREKSIKLIHTERWVNYGFLSSAVSCFHMCHQFAFNIKIPKSRTQWFFFGNISRAEEFKSPFNHIFSLSTIWWAFVYCYVAQYDCFVAPVRWYWWWYFVCVSIAVLLSISSSSLTNAFSSGVEINTFLSD